MGDFGEQGGAGCSVPREHHMVEPGYQRVQLPRGLGSPGHPWTSRNPGDMAWARDRSGVFARRFSTRRPEAWQLSRAPGMEGPASAPRHPSDAAASLRPHFSSAMTSIRSPSATTCASASSGSERGVL